MSLPTCCNPSIFTLYCESQSPFTICDGRYSDLCRELKNDRDDLFASWSQQQQKNAEMQRELAAARTDLAVVKDELLFARRAIKTMQSSSVSTNEALCVACHSSASSSSSLSSNLSPILFMFILYHNRHHKIKLNQLSTLRHMQMPTSISSRLFFPRLPHAIRYFKIFTLPINCNNAAPNVFPTRRYFKGFVRAVQRIESMEEENHLQSSKHSASRSDEVGGGF